ncbi:hypothetical protein PR048_025209 [Dryococelus australis]|uniref:Sodium/calcium exchanger membrane region domain-containing protein n=1 Tax=Dryococelus australis TaxID=614101 RepID=A0ABQ9GQR8_9NEOP|nr:hypothetical protein PR048_025209 [Dryococelus australis]
MKYTNIATHLFTKQCHNLKSNPRPLLFVVLAEKQSSVGTRDDGGGEDEKLPSCGDYVMHFVTLLWKLLFAFVPPTGITSRACRLRQYSTPYYSIANLPLFMQLDTRVLTSNHQQRPRTSSIIMSYVQRSSRGALVQFAFVVCNLLFMQVREVVYSRRRKLNKMSAYTRQKAKSKYRNRIRLERASQKQSSDTHKTPYDRVVMRRQDQDNRTSMELRGLINTRRNDAQESVSLVSGKLENVNEERETPRRESEELSPDKDTWPVIKGDCTHVVSSLRANIFAEKQAALPYRSLIRGAGGGGGVKYEGTVWRGCGGVELLRGYVCFVVSILAIGVVTAVIGDVASHFGSTLGVRDSVTAIVFVALGTSIPGNVLSLPPLPSSLTSPTPLNMLPHSPYSHVPTAGFTIGRRDAARQASADQSFDAGDGE